VAGGWWLAAVVRALTHSTHVGRGVPIELGKDAPAGLPQNWHTRLRWGRSLQHGMGKSGYWVLGSGCWVRAVLPSAATLDRPYFQVLPDAVLAVDVSSTAVNIQLELPELISMVKISL